ncbi:MAG: MmgE/PrpD family protein, partial [Halalkalicoccus sp.]
MADPDALSRFVADLAPDDLPPSTRDRAGLVVADTVGVIVGGSSTEPVSTLRRTYEDRYPGTNANLSTGLEPNSTLASVLGTSTRLPIELAAMCNGTTGTVLELDEGHKHAAGHPAVHVLPAVLAVAEADNGSGADLVTAFVAGYEVAVRFARACVPLADGYHPHGVWGVVGAAAAIANYRGLSAAKTANALAIAATHAQHTRFEAALEGATVRDTYAGMVAPDANAAVDQAEAGFTGLKDGIRRHLASASRGPIDELPTDDLGDRWELCANYFKVHAACRYTHPSLDALDELVTNEIDLKELESITVETYPAAATLDEPEPANRLAAKFSIPFAVATRLVHGHARKEAFEPEALQEHVFDLSRRVTVVSTPCFADAVPESRGARVTLAFSDKTRSETVEHARGGTERPFNEYELREKFRILVEPVL